MSLSLPVGLVFMDLGGEADHEPKKNPWKYAGLTFLLGESKLKAPCDVNHLRFSVMSESKSLIFLPYNLSFYHSSKLAQIILAKLCKQGLVFASTHIHLLKISSQASECEVN